MRTLSRVLPFALLLLVSPAVANNAADEADVAFELGNDRYAKGQYVEALREYFQSYRLVPNRNVLFNIARCYEALDRFDEAYRYYYDLSREELDATDRQDVARAMGRIRPKVALVSVETTPPGADVYVDRVDLGSRGRSPQVLAVRPGRHAIFVQLEGHRAEEAEVNLVRGRQVERTLTLQPILGKIKVAGSPEGAEIRLGEDGPVLGKVPATVQVPVGQRALRIAAPGHTPQQRIVEVSQTEPRSLEVALARAIGPAGKVIITTNRDGARVKINGKESGFAPTVLTLPEGEHQIEVSLPETRTVRQRIQVVRDQEHPLHAVLRYAPPPVQAASKSLTALEEAPASTSVITSDELRAFGYQTLTEALNGLRGVFLANDRMYEFMGIRGFAPAGDLNTRVLILYDGHAMNDVWAGQGYAGRDLAVDLEDIDRIEVVRGPGSALYGTSALFAVINLVPREGVGEGKNVELTVASGGLGSWRAHGAAAARTDFGLQARLSASVYDARGADFTDLGVAGVVLGLDSERVYNANTRLRYGDFSLSGAFNYRRKAVPTAPYNTVVNAPGTDANDIRGFAELKYERELWFGAVSARAYYDAARYRGGFAYPSDGDTVEVSTDLGEADWVGAEARSRLRLFGENHLTVGLETQHQLRVEHGTYGLGQDEALPSINRTVLSGYLLDEWAVHPRVFLSLGLRVDKYLDLDALPLTPRAALILRPYDGGVTKLVAGTAFRAPNVYELFYTDHGITILPPESLAPETITTAEFEHTHEVNPELRLTAAGYWNRISGLVLLTEDQAAVPQCGADPLAPEQCLRFGNSPSLLQALGGEAELHWQAGRQAMLDLSYSYVYLVGLTRAMTATPAHLISAKLLLPLGETGARVAVRAKYQSARAQEGELPIGEALLLDFGLSGEAGNFRYFAGVTNLLDARYSLPFGPDYPGPLPQLGRLFQVSVTASY
ncbi:MAG: TonB-dependent receptor [Myxococcota bacterium]|nr:TonB-dependent receptor [Myxococcota bacterium]